MIIESINLQQFYHGARTKFKEFDYRYLGTGTDQEGPGFYLTTSQEDAIKYTGPQGGIAIVTAIIDKIVPLRGKVNRSQIIQLIKQAPDLSDTLTNWHENPTIALSTAIQSVTDRRLGPHDAFTMVWSDFYVRKENGTKQYLTNMIKFGYDGVLIPRNGVSHFVAYNKDKLIINKWI